MAENIRRSVEALAIKNDKTPLGTVTVSIGVAAIENHEYADHQQLLKAADTAMYQAKKDQRNCVRSVGTTVQ
ncbi:hypothetical protein KBTX_02300 [wastewater metagenome]|uniref:GGDEF domain-containing protein n=2 Tax=unclassified sequences TaxID=12908 RepID=A0A5B8RBF9_9ZZZZ|nr:hypothetical protein KBTEX_02300 [uncultured organism]